VLGIFKTGSGELFAQDWPDPCLLSSRITGMGHRHPVMLE
jgi:hypothetical protein